MRGLWIQRVTEVMEKRKKGTAMRSKKAEEGLFSSDYCFGLQCILYTVMGVAASGCPRLSLGRVDIAVNREPSMRTSNYVEKHGEITNNNTRL